MKQKMRPSIKTCSLICTISLSMFVVMMMFAFDNSSYSSVFFVPNAYAINNTEAISGLATTVDLGSPFLIQIYSHDPELPQSESSSKLDLNNTNQAIINGNLSVTHVGNATEIPRDNDTVYFQGSYKLTTDNGMDAASYNFQAIGNYGPDDSYESRGVAIFDEVATGRLSFLANAVAIYKVKVDADDNGAFLMWQLR